MRSVAEPSAAASAPHELPALAYVLASTDSLVLGLLAGCELVVPLVHEDRDARRLRALANKLGAREALRADRTRRRLARARARARARELRAEVLA